MRFMLILFLSFNLSWSVEKPPVDAVVEGEPQPITLLNAGTNIWKILAVGNDATYRSWLSVCLDLPDGETLRSACVADLRLLNPVPSVLVSGFRVARAELPKANDPWMLAFGAEVPVAVARSVLLTVRRLHAGPLAVRGWNDSDKIISVSRLPDDGGNPTDVETLERLCGPLNDGAFRTLAGARPSNKIVFPSPEITDRQASVLVDLNLCSLDGHQPAATSALKTSGGTWTPAGLFLPGHRLLRFPPKYPTKQIEAPIPTAAYFADIHLPDDNARSATVTLVMFQASNEPERDNLFSLGRRSRWMSAQTGKKGELVVGLENRWALFSPQTLAKNPMTLPHGQWHTVTVGMSDGGLVIRVMVDGQAASDVFRPDIKGDVTPRRIDEVGNKILSFVDPGTPRHFHGFIQRVIIHRGLLSVDAMDELHHSLLTKDLAPPPSQLLLMPITGTVLSDPETDELKKPKPENANDF